MPFFRVDDQIHAHPKARRAGLAAMGLWALAGSYCMAYKTDGFVPEWWVKSQPSGAALARKLVDACLWKRSDGPEGEPGWLFHDWSDYQETGAQIEAKREKSRQRTQKWREAIAAGRKPEAPDEPRASLGTGDASGDASRDALVTRPFTYTFTSTCTSTHGVDESSPSPLKSPGLAEPVDNRPPLDPETAEGARLFLAPVCPEHGEKWADRQGSWHCTACITEAKAGFA